MICHDIAVMLARLQNFCVTFGTLWKAHYYIAFKLAAAHGEENRIRLMFGEKYWLVETDMRVEGKRQLAVHLYYVNRAVSSPSPLQMSPHTIVRYKELDPFRRHTMIDTRYVVKKWYYWRACLRLISWSCEQNLITQSSK